MDWEMKLLPQQSSVTDRYGYVNKNVWLEQTQNLNVNEQNMQNTFCMFEVL